MSNFTVTLFGKFKIEQGRQEIDAIRSRKAQELFTYLLLYRHRPQSREWLSELLWGDQPPAKSKKYLRQTLWLLQSALRAGAKSRTQGLLIDDEWVQINPSVGFHVDAVTFERIFQSVSEKRMQDLTPSDFSSLQKAIRLYKGDLLEGCYQDWCMIERERFEIMYLALLDKLVQLCELHQDQRTGLKYAAEILRHDPAYERAYRQMMRLYSLTGDRTQALRQYEHCVSALRDELGVDPSEETRRLYESIRSGRSDPWAQESEKIPAVPARSGAVLLDMLQRLMSFSDVLDQMHVQVQKEIMAIKHALPMDE